MQSTNFLIIGAGPFGLSMAAYCNHAKIDYLMVGKTMHFWESNMPKHMYLRSGIDWHLDPLEIHTIEKYMESEQITIPEQPLSRDFYLQYVNWFKLKKAIKNINRHKFTTWANSGESSTNSTLLFSSEAVVT